jgi:hypothetical protein
MTDEIKYHQKVNIVNYNELAEAVRKCLLGYSVDVIVMRGDSHKILLTEAEKNKINESAVTTLKFNHDDIIAFAHHCLTKTELHDIINHHI